MNFTVSRLRWLRIFGAALAVVALSLVVVMLVTAGYAFYLAYQARGAPDQSAINRFASGISPIFVPWLECFLALILSFKIGRKTEAGSTTQGLFIGILAGLLGLAVALFFRGHLSPSSVIFSLGVAGAGCLGGFLGEKWPARK
jgi:multisubunit Na+/H+ antiporter MnhB subunit